MRGPPVAGVTLYGLVVAAGVHWLNGSATLVDSRRVAVPVQLIVNGPPLNDIGLKPIGPGAYEDRYVPAIGAKLAAGVASP